MKGIFVNENGGIRYAEAIVKGIKPVETRSKNMLSACVGERVAIIRTRRNKKPTIVGYADITASWWCSKEMMDNIRDYTIIPEGSKYDSTSRGKWCYWMSKAEECDPYELPSSAIRHGRSWCEFDVPETSDERNDECTGECDSCPYKTRVPGDYDRIDREPRYFCKLYEN